MPINMRFGLRCRDTFGGNSDVTLNISKNQELQTLKKVQFSECSIQELMLCTLLTSSCGLYLSLLETQWADILRRCDPVIYCLHWNTLESDRSTISNYTGTSYII